MNDGRLGRKEREGTMGGGRDIRTGRRRGKNNGCRKSRMPIVFFVPAIRENNCVGGAQKAKQLRAESFIVQSGSDAQIGSAEEHEPSFRKVGLGFAFIVSSQNGRIEGPAPDMAWTKVFDIMLPSVCPKYGEIPAIVFLPEPQPIPWFPGLLVRLSPQIRPLTRFSLISPT